VALSQDAYTTFRATAGPGAIVIIDEDLVTPEAGDAVLRVPATRLADQLGQRRCANVVMLGFLTAVTGLVDRGAVERAVETSVKSKTVPLNLKAFAAGYEHAAARAPA